MNYQDFIKTKKIKIAPSGFDIEREELNPMLFEFQKDIVIKALHKGRFAVFADCGLGKTPIQLEWASQVTQMENKPILILAPLAVTHQTIEEGDKFGIKVNEYGSGYIQIINYEQLENLDTSKFIGVVLDESSILKSVDGKTKNLIIDKFRNTPYKLCCSATPSPNDHMELGNHSAFLGHMSYHEMLAMFFVHDGGQTSKWRLRKHAESDFWEYVLSWSIALDNPKTLGYKVKGFDLPEINYIEHLIEVESDGLNLFGEAAVSATELNRDLRKTMDLRCQKAADIVRSNPNEQWIIWGLQNKECELLNKLIPNSVNVQGSDKAETKSKHLLGFGHKEIQNLITKPSIASFGMNYQQAHNMIFCSYNFGFESFYQAVRREYRFGQTSPVNVHVLVPKSQINVRKTILEKEKKHKSMIKKLSILSKKYSGIDREFEKLPDVKTSNYWLMHGDCVERSKDIPSNEVDFCVFSPPFAELYVYSDDPKDMGNSSDYQEFSEHFQYLIPEIKRVLKPGRICAIHCMDLPIQKGKEGYIGLRDFSGMIVDWFSDQGFIYHSRVTIWKNPVTEMQRTKALGLLHKQIKKDSCMSRVGIPDYILLFRNEGDNPNPIKHQDKDPSSSDYLPVDLWQKYASPIWYDVDYGRTLQYTTARDSNDEKHIAPLQLDTIERLLHLYSNEGDTVLSPFGGIGSEGFQALKMNRKSISIELKASYFKVNSKNHECAILEKSQLTLI